MTEKDFTEGQQAIIERVAWAVGEKIAVQMEKNIAAAVAMHQATCPGQKKIEEIASEIKEAAAEKRGVGKGMALALGIGSATGGAGLVELIRHIL